MNASRFTPRARRTTIGVLAILAVASLGACSGSGTKDAVKSTNSLTPVESTTTVVGSNTDDPAAPTGDQQGGSDQSSSGNGSDQGGSGNTSNGNSGGGSGGGQTPQPPSSPNPTITSFSTPENIDCHNGNSQMFTASWATSNATKVTISIDGPGIYDTYGPSGSTSLPFGCATSHTYLLTAFNDAGKTATKKITLQPRNVQPDPGSSSDDEESPTADQP